MLQGHVALLFASLNHYFQSSLTSTYNSDTTLLIPYGKGHYGKSQLHYRNHPEPRGLAMS
jgi:hypothetical protein